MMQTSVRSIILIASYTTPICPPYITPTCQICCSCSLSVRVNLRMKPPDQPVVAEGLKKYKQNDSKCGNSWKLIGRIFYKKFHNAFRFCTCKSQEKQGPKYQKTFKFYFQRPFFQQSLQKALILFKAIYFVVLYSTFVLFREKNSSEHFNLIYCFLAGIHTCFSILCERILIRFQNALLLRNIKIITCR